MALTYRNPHEHSKEVASDELVSLESEEAQIQERLRWIKERTGQLRAYLAAIVPLIENDPGQAFADSGLTAMCRDILTSVGRWITAHEVRSRLEASGINLNGYTNPMAVLHSILKRIGLSARSENGILYYGVPGLNPDKLPAEPPSKEELAVKAAQGMLGARLEGPFAGVAAAHGPVKEAQVTSGKGETQVAAARNLMGIRSARRSGEILKNLSPKGSASLPEPKTPLPIPHRYYTGDTEEK